MDGKWTWQRKNGRGRALSHVNCPLCGRSQALSRFNPEILDNDVYLVSFRGLGRGKGFIKSGEHSILHPGDPTVELIKNRMLEIIGFFIEKNCVTLNEILNVIQLPDPRLLLNLSLIHI